MELQHGFGRGIFCLLLWVNSFEIRNSNEMYFFFKSFVCGNSPNNTEKLDSPFIDDIIRHTAFNQSNPTTLYIHGYMEDQTSDTVVTVVDAYARRGNNNFIALNWEFGACDPTYAVAVRNVYQVNRDLKRSRPQADIYVYLLFRLVE